MVSYGQVLERLAHFFDTEKSAPIPFRRDDYNLQPLTDYLAAQGALRLAPNVFHVAGTKGKGSVTTLLSELCQAHGQRVGSYLSPHLVSYRERIRIQGKAVSEQDFARWVSQALDEKPSPGGSPIRSVFEALTAAMAIGFTENKLDAAVVEVGLGGRLDATNVFSTDVSILTPVSYDHTEVLGDTIPKIAAEKAGILRAGHPVVVGWQHPEGLEVIERRAAELGCRIYRLGKEFKVHEAAGALEVEFWDGTVVEGLHPAMRGQFQADNTAVALAAFLVRFGVLDPDRARFAVSQARLRGRFEEIRLPNGARIVLDGAHNPFAARLLADEVRRFEPEHLHLMLAVSSNKDARGILEPLLPLADSVSVTSFGGPRALSPEALLGLVHEQGSSAELWPDVRAAWKHWQSFAKPNSVLLATGSLFLVGALLGILNSEGWTLLEPPPDPEFF